MPRRMMVALVGLLLLATATTTAHAQGKYETRKAAKLAKPWIKKAGWILDYDKALEEAKKSGKLIFAYFSRSYAK